MQGKLFVFVDEKIFFCQINYRLIFLHSHYFYIFFIFFLQDTRHASASKTKDQDILYFPFFYPKLSERFPKNSMESAKRIIDIGSIQYILSVRIKNFQFAAHFTFLFFNCICEKKTADKLQDAFYHSRIGLVRDALCLFAL